VIAQSVVIEGAKRLEYFDFRARDSLPKSARKYRQAQAALLGNDATLFKEACRTAYVEAWLKAALEVEGYEPVLIRGEGEDTGWLALRKAIMFAESRKECYSTSPEVTFGLYLAKTTGDARIVERFDLTNQITNSFDERKDPVGLGALLGYKFTPGGGVAVMPFVSLDWPNISVNHTFTNGSFLGTRSNVSATAGVKVGPQFQNVWLYGIAGVSVLNETLNVNFIPVASSTSATVAGATVGVGFAYQLPNLPHPMSLFAEYQHTWWQDATFNTPAASPFFNYTFSRSDDVVKVGFTVPLGAPSAPLSPSSAAPSYSVKALPK
jgi:hypothetical protein